VPRTRLMRYGPRSFAVSGPVLWNSLPAAVRDPALTVLQFLRCLKTELFSRAYWLSSQRLVMAFALRLREQQEPYHHYHHHQCYCVSTDADICADVCMGSDRPPQWGVHCWGWHYYHLSL